MFKAYFTKIQGFFFSPVIFQTVLGMLGASIVMLIMHLVDPTAQPRIATVNITGIVNQFIQSEAKEHLPQAVLQQRVQAFGKYLQMTLDNIAKKNQVVLLPQEAVIAGAKDVTPQVIAQIQKMQRFSKTDDSNA